MKKLLSNWLFVLVFAVSISVMASSAQARCVWVPPHWEHGYHHSGHQVCYHHGYRHCGWRHGRRVCPY